MTQDEQKDARWKELVDAGCVGWEDDHGASGIGDYALMSVIYCPECLRKNPGVLVHLKMGGWACDDCLKKRLAATGPQEARERLKAQE